MQKTTSPVTAIRKVADGAITASANSNKVNAGGYGNAVAYLRVTAASGTTPTLDMKFQDSPDGTNYQDVPSGAFTQKTAAGSQRLVLSNIGPFLRAVQTIGGTSPSFTYDLHVAGIN